MTAVWTNPVRLGLLLGALAALAPAAAGANAWEIPQAGPIYRSTFWLAEGTTYEFEFRTETPGADVTIRLWSTGARREVARESICHPSGEVDDACLTYTAPRRGSGYYLLVAHATANGTNGTGLVFQNGRRVAGTLLAQVPFAGYRQPLGDAGGAEVELSTVLVPGGTPDTYLLLLDRGELIRMDDDGGIGLASRVTLTRESNTQVAIVGSNRADQIGPARLLANDRRWAGAYRDEDWDGVGDRLERALLTCPSRGWSPHGWDCAAIGDPADTDGDGILDAAEVFGISEVFISYWPYLTAWILDQPAVLLPRWGASPRHKDLFVEADWRGQTPDPVAVPPLESCPTPRADPAPSRRMLGSHAQAWADYYALLPNASLANPDRVDGVALHVDVMDGAGPGYGDWGGATCVPTDDPVIVAAVAAGHSDYGAARPIHMAANRRTAFHYALVPGGQGEMPGLAFSTSTDARTAAEELGHNLVLDHDGPADGPPGWGIKVHPLDTLNCKPHYLSGMNYAWTTDPTRSGQFFSRGGYRDRILDKTNLDETAGIGPGPDPLPLLPTFLEGDPFHYGRGSANGLAIDWNHDGRFDRSVAAPLNFARRSCATFHRGAGFLAADRVSATPAMGALGNVYYVLYARAGRLYYRREVRATPFPHVTKQGTEGYRGGERWADGADPWSWSAEAEITGLFSGVTQLDAEEFLAPDGTPTLVVVYRNLTGSLAWLTIRYDAATRTDVIEHRGRLRAAAGTFALADPNGMELEPFANNLWLAYTWLGSVRILRLQPDWTWTFEVVAEDGAGAVLRPSSIGIGLASDGGRELLMVLGFTAAGLDPRAARLRIYEYGVFTGLWHHRPARLPFDINTTTEPAIAFRADPRHRFGGWYMLAYRNPPANATDPLRDRFPEVRITDGAGVFLGNPVGRLKDVHLHMPEDPHAGIALAVPFDRRESVLGALMWDDWDRGRYRSYLEFLPYADGVSPTRARDHDDAAGIRFGLCYSLRGPRPECNPPPRLVLWVPVVPMDVPCAGH